MPSYLNEGARSMGALCFCALARMHNWAPLFAGSRRPSLRVMVEQVKWRRGCHNHLSSLMQGHKYNLAGRNLDSSTPRLFGFSTLSTARLFNCSTARLFDYSTTRRLVESLNCSQKPARVAPTAKARECVKFDLVVSCKRARLWPAALSNGVMIDGGARLTGVKLACCAT